VFLVLRGRIALHRVAPCGREIAPALLGPGSIVGADALAEFGGRRSTRAVAMTDATGLLVTASDLMRILKHDGTVASNVVRILCLQQEAVVAALEELATLNVVERIARFLARLAAPSDGQWTDTVRVGLPLTHEQIAAFVASSRETVSLEMGRLVRSGRVVRDQHGYAVRREPEGSRA
jgi:CRP-like cAMP-binding protein